MRIWAFDKLEGTRSPGTPQTEFGQDTHTVLEDWLTVRKVPSTKTKQGKVAAHGLSLLPAPSPHIEVERHFAYKREFEGRQIHYHGYVDFAYWRIHPVHGLEFVAGDHKTTGNLGWMLDELTLPLNPQAVLYAVQAMVRFGLDYVVLRWVYYQTKGGTRKSEATEVRITREQCEEVMETVDATAGDILDARKEHPGTVDENRKLKVALTFDPNPLACGKYRGCHNRDRCNLTSNQRFVALMHQEGRRVTALEKLKARNAKKKAGNKDTKPEEKSPGAAVPGPDDDGTKGNSVNSPEGMTPEESVAADKADVAAEANAPAETKTTAATSKKTSRAKSTTSKAKKMDLGEYLCTEAGEKLVAALTAALTAYAIKNMPEKK